MNKYLKNNQGFSPIIILLLVVAVAIVAILGFSKFKTNPSSQQTNLSHPKVIGIIQNAKGLDDVYSGFKAGLAELGYKENETVIYDYQYTNLDPKMGQQIAKNFVNKNVDLMLAISTASLAYAYNESTTSGKPIPIVFTNGVTALQQGLIKSYQSSGNNVTGLVPDDVSISVKKLDFLKMINPNAKKVGVFSSHKIPAATVALNALIKAAPGLGLEIVDYKVSTDNPLAVDNIEKVTAGIKTGDIDAIMTLPDPINAQLNKSLQDLGLKLKTPTLFLNSSDGGLLSYNVDSFASGKEAAIMADKIFKGIKPTDIPIEFPRKNLLIIDLRVAKQMGITIPNSLLSIADKKIE